MANLSSRALLPRGIPPLYSPVNSLDPGGDLGSRRSRARNGPASSTETEVPIRTPAGGASVFFVERRAEVRGQRSEVGKTAAGLARTNPAGPAGSLLPNLQPLTS